MLYTLAEEIRGVVKEQKALSSDPSDEPHPLEAIAVGLDYHMTLVSDTGRQRDPFGPMWVIDGQAYPKAADQMGPEVHALWQIAAESCPLALPMARWFDLLWISRFGPEPHKFAHLAIDSYVAAAEQEFGNTHEVSEGLRRALDIALELNDGDRIESAVAALVSRAEWALRGEERLAGTALTAIEDLANLPPRYRPMALSDLLDEAVNTYRGDAWSVEAALDIKAKLVPEQARQALRVEQVRAFVDTARSSEGLRRFAILQHAIEVAETHGLREMASALRLEVEGISEEDLGLQRISTEVNIPAEVIDGFVDGFVGSDDLILALQQFGSYVPSGDPDETRQKVREQMVEFPLRHIFPTMVLGPSNSLIARPTTAAEKEEHAVIEHEQFQIQFFGQMAVEIIERLQTKHGSLSTQKVWLAGGFIQPLVAERMIHAIELYEDGDFDASASLLTPLVERSIRELAQAAGLPITRGPTPRGQAGGVKGLGAILEALSGILNEASRRYFIALLSEPTGLNIRNRVSHGLTDGATNVEAALLIHVALHIRGLVAE